MDKVTSDERDGLKFFENIGTLLFLKSNSTLLTLSPSSALYSWIVLSSVIGPYVKFDGSFTLSRVV